MPVSPDYLSLALHDGHQVGDTTLSRRQLADLRLPTGRLVACDPFVTPDAAAFSLALPPGTWPVTFSIATFRDADERIAFAALHFRETTPVRWQMMVTTMGQRDFYYPVDAGTGCFMDQSTGDALVRRMAEVPDYYEMMGNEMEKTYRHTWSWLDMTFGDGNIIAFSSGLGDGGYATYAGFDVAGDLTIVVTDFSVVVL